MKGNILDTDLSSKSISIDSNLYFHVLYVSEKYTSTFNAYDQHQSVGKILQTISSYEHNADTSPTLRAVWCSGKSSGLGIMSYEI